MNSNFPGLSRVPRSRLYEMFNHCGVMVMSSSNTLVSAMDVVERAIADLVSSRQGQTSRIDQSEPPPSAAAVDAMPAPVDAARALADAASSQEPGFFEVTETEATAVEADQVAAMA